MRTDRPRRWWMRSSTWRALGNTYRRRRAEGAEPLDAARASTLAEGTDGVLEDPGDERARSVEVAIWNPDGSRAELSGQRHAYRRRRGSRRSREHDEVDVVVGDATSCARASTRTAEIGAGSARSTVGRDEEIADGIAFVPGLGGQPARGRARRSADDRRDSATRLETHCALSGPHERPGRPRRRAGRGQPRASGSEEWGDAVVGHERRCRCRGDARRRRGARPLSRRRSPRTPRGHGVRRSTARPSASTDSGLRELDQAAVGIAEVRGAPPRIVARLDEERRPLASASSARRRGRRPRSRSGPRSAGRRPSRQPARGRGACCLPTAKQRAARPLRDRRRTYEVAIEGRSCRSTSLREQRDLADVLSCRDLELPGATSLSEVLRSVDALREPTMSAHGRS